MARALMKMSLTISMLVLLSGCYSPQSMNLASSVALWRAAQSAPAAEVSADDETPSWTAEALVARALTHNPELLSWAARVEAGAAAIDAAGEFDDLQLRLTRASLSDFEQGDPKVDVAEALAMQPSVNGKAAEEAGEQKVD